MTGRWSSPNERRMSLRFGVNLNNREPLIAPGYGIPQLLDLSETVVEELGFDSVWVGDSLFSKPRYESMALLSALSQRTKRVKLGTACIVTSPRNPLYLALEWATLDVLSGGRTIFGPCAGNPEQGVRREFEALGLDFDKRFAHLRGGARDRLRQLWTERQGHASRRAQYDYDDISFYSGTEMGPLMPIQQPPPFWIVSNPRLVTDAARREDGAHHEDRVPAHPQVRRRLDDLLSRPASRGAGGAAGLPARGGRRDRRRREPADGLLPGDAQHRRLGGRRAQAFGDYIGQYYPELSKATWTSSNWGPVGSPDQIIDWFRTFADGGGPPFHLPLRLARPVRAGGALRPRGAAGTPRVQPSEGGNGMANPRTIRRARRSSSSTPASRSSQGTS